MSVMRWKLDTSAYRMLVYCTTCRGQSAVTFRSRDESGALVRCWRGGTIVFGCDGDCWAEGVAVLE
jgi:hypothetical protein